MIELWANTSKVIKNNLKKVKPCKKLGYCPYGVLVEEFPLKMKSKISCELFGHDCPVFYVAEGLEEELR